MTYISSSSVNSRLVSNQQALRLFSSQSLNDTIDIDILITFWLLDVVTCLFTERKEGVYRAPGL